MESIDVTLSQVVYHQPSKYNAAGRKFLIGRTSAGDTIKGEMDKPIEFDRYQLWGEWRPQKGYSRPAFEFSTFEPIIEQSADGFAVYLANYVDGLGPVKSRALVEEFGTDTLKTLRENPEAAAAVKGITPALVESIRKHFASQPDFDPMAYATLIEMFAGHKVPRRIVKKLLKDWGSDAPAKIRERPYLLLAYPGLGWKIVDAFATATAGYPADGVERHKAALVESLERISDQGHTYGTKTDVEAIAFQLVNGCPPAEAWDAALADELIVARETDDGTVYTLPKLAEAEETIAERLADLAATAAPLPFPLDADGLLAGQQAALRLVEGHGVVIVAGAPGVGKTYTVTRALAGLVKHGFASITFVAPTGKAAKRAAELLQRALPGVPIQPSTVHRALGPVPSDAPEGVPAGDAKVNRGREEFGFSKNEDSPIEAQVIVCDESSMLDVKLAADLLKAVASGTRVIFVGDPNQLPSVGPGSVLRDLIAAGVPTATLSEVQRNCGTIVRACHSIMAGIPPVPASRVDLANGENWIHLEIDEPAAIAAKIVDLHRSVKMFDPVWEMQVISPEKGKPGVGCNDLNRLLSDALNAWKKSNAHAAPEDENAGRTPEFVCGDKVVRTKNGLCDLMTRIPADDTVTRADWTWDGSRWKLEETDIVNGDMGDVVDICTEGDQTYVVVEFQSPRRTCRLPYTGCHLTAAYAMTCHKAQGSGFPYVILPVHHSFYYNTKTGEGLWNREMIYTMFSRAERLLVTVGPYSAIEAAVKRPSVNRRKTRLRGLAGSLFPIASRAEVEYAMQLAGVPAPVAVGSLAGTADDPGADADF